MVSPVAGFASTLISQRPSTLVTVAGVPTPAEVWSTRHGINQPVGSCSLTIPVGGDIGHIDFNTPVEVQAGYADEPTERTFSGRIVDIDRNFDDAGQTIRLQCEDWSSLLAFPSEVDTVYTGATPFYEIYRSLATVRGLPLWDAEPVTYPDGTTTVVFGGVAGVDGGNVVIKRRTPFHTWLNQKARLFGYRVFGIPAGVNRLQRISGQPAAEPVATFAEGVDLFRIGVSGSIGPMVTNWTVNGARYTDDDGVTIEIRSIPDTVPPEPYLDPPGYRSDDISDSILVTQELADACRNVMEIDYGAPWQEVTWETWGRPEIQPGDVIAVMSPSVGIADTTAYWVTGVRHEWSDRGYTTILTGWAGGGAPLAAGIDEAVIPIGTGPYRLGDEFLSHYVIPAAGGESQIVPFTVPDTYTSLALRGRQHGTNSYLLGGVNTDSTVSKLEVWQGGERVGSAQLPVAPENLSLRLDYDNDAHWRPFRMPIPGQLEPGSAELHITAGKDNRIGVSFRIDDFEVKNLEVEARGTGSPVLPGGGA